MVREWCSSVLHKTMRTIGEYAAKKPIPTMMGCIIFTILISLGTLRFHHEKNPLKLWVPPESFFVRDTHWLLEKTSKAYRAETVILSRDSGLLKPDVISFIVHLTRNITMMTVKSSNTTLHWDDVCFKIPSLINVPASERVRRRADPADFDDDFFTETQLAKPTSDSEFDPSIELDSDVYCAILNSLPLACLTTGVSDLWREEDLPSLDEDKILQRLNEVKFSPSTGHGVDYSVTLSGVSRDSEGKILDARGLSLTWFVQVDIDKLDHSKTGNRAGTEDWATVEALDWEFAYLNLVQAAASSAKALGLQMDYASGRSFGDVSSTEMMRDANKIVGGAVLMFFYMLIILSKWDPVEIRNSLAAAALFCVGLSLICSVGICSLFGISYGPVHDSLPFLLMGLGIDDMFVIKACWENLSEEERALPSITKIGLTMSHAGVSILVTSFTDVIAFLVGSITVLPSLNSFCIYAAVAVSFLFVFSITFYVAAFSLDLKRVEEGRNGFLPCIKHPLPRPTYEGGSISRRVLRVLFSKFIFRRPVKVIIIIGTVVMSSFSLAALLRLEQRFDPTWFIPDTSYYKDFLNSKTKFFPDAGYEAMFMVGAVDYAKDLPKIVSIVDEFKTESKIVKGLDSWTDQYGKFVALHFGKNISIDVMNDREWKMTLGKFLVSPKGAKYRRNFQFSQEFVCGKPTPDVTVSTVNFSFKNFTSPTDYLPAMHKLLDVVDVANISTGEKYASIWSRAFANWVTDEVIQNEVERNLELALVCVMACTWILIMNLQICLWIFVCVMLTLINVCGCMHYWGMTIDIVSCVGLELAIGLCVDYAAHVGHTFLLMKGTREERALSTVTSIGAAVLYGGGSTMLSLSLLSLSETYIFKSFFKIFFLVIIFGLFNGIIFLPIVLSLVGPNTQEINHGKIESENKDVHLEQLDHLDPQNEKHFNHS